MKRKEFLKTIALSPILGKSMNLDTLNKLARKFPTTPKMPVLFLGHGSPMNAIEDNEFVKGFKNIGKTLPKPQAIICVSAHWETRGTFVTAMQKPRTIHDFGGFPKALFEVKYPAEGSPELANATKELIKTTDVQLDEMWGLDHGAWSVLLHLFPKADVPVVQLSLDRTKAPKYHYELAKALSELRSKGVLIIGSGNMVHNLRLVAWQKLNEVGYAYDWAQEASETMKKHILDSNHAALINFSSQGKAFDLAIPTPEHYLPLLYALALKEDKDDIELFNDQAIAGSLTMTSIKIGSKI